MFSLKARRLFNVLHVRQSNALGQHLKKHLYNEIQYISQNKMDNIVLIQ